MLSVFWTHKIKFFSFFSTSGGEAIRGSVRGEAQDGMLPARDRHRGEGAAPGLHPGVQGHRQGGQCRIAIHATLFQHFCLPILQIEGLYWVSNSSYCCCAACFAAICPDRQFINRKCRSPNLALQFTGMLFTHDDRYSLTGSMIHKSTELKAKQIY